MMKLISLNTYGGILGKPFIEFIQENLNSTDIFCFQEVFESKNPKKNTNFNPVFFSQLQNLMSDFNGYYAPSSKNHDLEGKVNYEIQFGLAIFVRKTIKVYSIEKHMIFNKKFADIEVPMTKLPKNIQIIKIEKDGKIYHIFNLHGVWYPSDKKDSEDRIKQSKKILVFVNKKSGKKIVCGDFNLMPYTKSIKMFEKDLVNLIAKFDIKTTRVEKFQRHLPKQNFADYTFVSKDIKVKNFAVPDLEISDHLPMILEFE